MQSHDMPSQDMPSHDMPSQHMPSPDGPSQDMQSQNMPRSQKQQHQLQHQMQSILEYNLANEETYYTSDEEAYYTNDEEEDPTPTWNLPNWKGNREEPNIHHDKCTGCITDVRNGEIRGCKDCDEFWDLPELEEMVMPMTDCEAVQIINIHNVFVGEGKI